MLCGHSMQAWVCRCSESLCGLMTSHELISTKAAAVWALEAGACSQLAPAACNSAVQGLDKLPPRAVQHGLPAHSCRY